MRILGGEVHEVRLPRKEKLETSNCLLRFSLLFCREKILGYRKRITGPCYEINRVLVESKRHLDFLLVLCEQ